MKTFSHLFLLRMKELRIKAEEKIKTNILCSVTFFRKSLYEIKQKMSRLRGHKWRHNMAHTRCMLDKPGYPYARTCTRTSARAPTHAGTRAHIHICNTYWFFTAIMIRERASVLRYTYVACLVKCTAVLCMFCAFEEASLRRQSTNRSEDKAGLFLVQYFVCTLVSCLYLATCTEQSSGEASSSWHTQEICFYGVVVKGFFMMGWERRGVWPNDAG